LFWFPNSVWEPEQGTTLRRELTLIAKRTKWILWGSIIILILVFGGLQVRALTRDYDNPPVIQEPNWDSPRTRELANRACFDCHSNETHWPWYSRIYPMSDMLRHDVTEGRKVLNFSEWTVGHESFRPEEAVETVAKGQMPLPYYVILHPEADLNDAERAELINGLIATFQEVDPELEAEDVDEGE
jgi:hypothetical protein